MDDEMRDTVWEYLGCLRRPAVCFMLCDRMPPSLTNVMEEMGSSLAGASEPPDIRAMGETIMQQLTGPEAGGDMSAMQSLLADPAALSDMCAVAMEQLQQMQGGPLMGAKPPAAVTSEQLSELD